MTVYSSSDMYCFSAASNNLIEKLVSSVVEVGRMFISISLAAERRRTEFLTIAMVRGL